jgi:hypothetical protein
LNPWINELTGYRTKSILVVPIVALDESIVGVVEMLNRVDGEFGPSDIELLRAFSQFQSIALEYLRLKDIAHFGDVELEMPMLIGERERDWFTPPNNLQMTQVQRDAVLTLNCFGCEYKGIDHFKELFHFFARFHLFETFQISNERFFRFVFNISAKSNQVAYHNWTHACDVTQYVAYELEVGEVDKVLTSFEIFGLLMAAIYHDTDHEGFNNIFKVKAETPYWILFKNLSVMEIHHISESIPVITSDKVLLFGSLTTAELKRMWNLWVSLILTTDMVRDFELVKEAQILVDEPLLDMSNQEHRIMAMKLILKVADISNVSWPFRIADK